MNFIRRPRSALRAMDERQHYFHDARIVLHRDESLTLETFWRNPEIAGVWIFRHAVHRDCFWTLHNRGTIAQAEKTETGEQCYRLTRPG